MDTLSFKTVSANANTKDKVNENTIQRKWWVVDAEAEIVGRLAARIAYILRGKHKPMYTPHVDCGDNVIVINADKVRLTGKKLIKKEYIRYTGYPGGQRFTPVSKLLKTHPTRVLEHAIYGMLPKTKLGEKLKNRLFIYAGATHPHEAQKPEKLTVTSIKK
ncbi:MAG: 50S ribosomal protein L13 [Bacteroidia bacterium]|nr:50S ribosomal protein L13 [Bacteroidia bacterium]MDW8346644.1 50S ribosomal protein L13 [Bacteroidia bacterium]